MPPPKLQSKVVDKLDKFRRSEAPAQSSSQSPQHSASDSDRDSADHPGPSPDTEKVLAAIHACQTTLTTRIEEIKVDISLLRQDAQRTRERVTEVEQRVSTLEDQAAPLTGRVMEAERHIAKLHQHLDDQENRLRRCNLRFVGLPERAEGSSPETFLENLLISTFGRDQFSVMFAVERAHRILPKPPPPGAPPRTFIAKLLNYRDRDVVLRLTREKGPILHDNAQISVYPDFSVEVQKKRALFLTAKKRLRELNLKYAMLYPAKMKITVDGRSYFFSSPQEVFDWLESRPRATRGSPPRAAV